MTDNQTLGELLNDALVRLDRQPAWLASRLAVNKATVSRWLSDAVTPTVDNVRRAADVLGIRGDDLSRLLAAAGYAVIVTGDAPTSATQTSLALSVPLLASEPEPLVMPAVEAEVSLPPKPYRRLVGRFEQLDEILGIVRESGPPAGVAVVGMGGIGKTALVREVVETCVTEQQFDHVVWTTAKREHFLGNKVIADATTLSSFESLVGEIARQCGRTDLAFLPPDARVQAVARLLHQRRVLIVVDNLETVPEADALMRALVQIRGVSRLLVTSRHYVDTFAEFYVLRLRGLPQEEGLAFLREEARQHNVGVVQAADTKSLLDLYTSTGGAPLAMRLVTGQLYVNEIDTVLKTLTQTSFTSKSYPFYQFVYQHSWQLLHFSAQMALVDLSVFPVLTGGTVADVQSVSQVSDADFATAMTQLVSMSLADFLGTLGQARYALHPLTQYFIRSDITREWASTGQAP